MKLVSNGTLQRANVKKRIERFWNVAMLKPRETWLPPLFHQPAYVDEAFLSSGLRQTQWNVSSLRVGNWLKPIKVVS
jgi:hypothetical protein